jgi:hypothetical protein
MPISNFGRDQILDWVWNADAAGIPTADLWLQLHSGDPNRTGASNQVAHTRIQVAVPASSSGNVANSSQLNVTTGIPTVGGDGIWGWSVFDASSAGNCWWWGPLTTTEGVADAGSAEVTSNLFHSGAHGLTTNDRVCFFDAAGAAGGNIGGPSLIGTGTGVLYYVIATGLTTDAFSVSTTQGGAALDITADGQLRWFKVGNKTTNSGDTFQIAASALSVFLEA